MRPIYGKRIFDVLASAGGLVLLSPLMVVLGILVRATSPGPAVYRGARVGRYGRDFDIFKFRTMWNRPSSQLTTGFDDPRVTPIGRKLRKYKLDELPQLLNVLRGDMSIVGPRPEFRKWVELYDAQERVSLEVRPGITDLASLEFIDLDRHVGLGDADESYLQVAFRRKNELRIKYVIEMSWRNDLLIIARTLGRLARRS